MVMQRVVALENEQSRETTDSGAGLNLGLLFVFLCLDQHQRALRGQLIDQHIFAVENLKHTIAVFDIQLDVARGGWLRLYSLGGFRLGFSPVFVFALLVACNPGLIGLLGPAAVQIFDVGGLPTTFVLLDRNCISLRAGNLV